MMKKTMILISIICAALLAGCGNGADNSNLSGKMKDKAVAATQKAEKEEPDNSEEKEEKEEENEEEIIEEEAQKGVPDILLLRQNEFKYLESSTPAIKHQYTYFMLDGESTGKFKALAASLEDARDEMLAKQHEVWDKDLKSIEENDLITFDETWMVYLRRADEKYLSFVSEFCSEGLFDDGAYTEYTAHSYYVDNGKEIAFSDVIADENAFYDLLADKMYESINEKLQQYYSYDMGID